VRTCIGRQLRMGQPARVSWPSVLNLQRLASYGVGFHSYTEPMLSTDNEMVLDIVLAVIG